eukprot:3936524-Rhodomonas_salina.1
MSQPSALQWRPSALQWRGAPRSGKRRSACTPTCSGPLHARYPSAKTAQKRPTPTRNPGRVVPCPNTGAACYTPYCPLKLPRKPPKIILKQPINP